MGARKALLGSASIPTLTCIIPVTETTVAQDSAGMEKDQNWDEEGENWKNWQVQ